MIVRDHTEFTQVLTFAHWVEEGVAPVEVIVEAASGYQDVVQ